MDINKFKYCINNSYAKDTCYPSLQDEWSLDNKALGHCAIVAIKVYMLYGGEIRRVSIKGSNIRHYYNYVNNEIIDLTKSQFKNNEEYENEVIKTYEDVISNSEFSERYKIFDKKFNDMANKLDEIDNKILNCERCRDLVEKFNYHTSINYGISNDLLIVGEAPANNGWRKSGKCWYDINGNITGSGRIMNKLLQTVNMKVEDVTFIEAVKCYPVLRSNLSKCKLNCYSYLEEQIKLLNPKVILTLGDTATCSVLKDLKYKNFAEVVGKQFVLSIDFNNYCVIPIYHPSPISPKGYKGNLPIFSILKDIL